MLLMTIYVFTFPKYKTEQITVAFFGDLLCGGDAFLPVSGARPCADGKYLVWLIFLSSWGCDTCAYCAGMLLGKHKMAPKLSPKKIGGGSRGRRCWERRSWAFYTARTLEAMMVELAQPGVMHCAAACAIAAVISQIGDLAASAIKRNHGVKDYGTSDPRPRRDPGPVRQHDLYGPGHLLCSDVSA